MPGKLILCATPIGNLEDITQRVLRVLAEADVVACEDTRRTRKLLEHFSIRARDLVVLNEQTERRQAPLLVDRIGKGATVALVADAGMPGVSDPGYRLVRACVQAGHHVEVAPGPNAALTALVASGLPPARFVFEGFLPRKQGERRRRLAELAGEARTIVFYESPHRIAASLADMAEVLGPERPAALARELTKMHEEIRRAGLAELARSAVTDPPRGEIVVVVGGAERSVSVDPPELARLARALMDEGVDRKEAMQQVARHTGVPRRAVFDALLNEES